MEKSATVYVVQAKPRGTWFDWVTTGTIETARNFVGSHPHEGMLRIVKRTTTTSIAEEVVE